jgi:gliding motility-associated lipoprotein GldD
VILRTAKITILAIVLCASFGCREVSVPKPRGHFRIDLPARKYIEFNSPADVKSGLPLSFEYPEYGRMTFQGENSTKSGWFNIEFPRYKAKIYLTYKDVHNDLDSLLDQSYNLNVKNHVSKADAIKEQVVSNPDNKVYGILYDLKGNTASAVEFYVTDSISHYLRGSLYFSSEPNADSTSCI